MVTKAVERAFHADENDRASRTLAALNLIGEQLSRIHGRKSLLWLTGGLNVTRDSWAVQTTIDKLSDADVAVYTVDTRGVVMDPGTSAENDSNDLAAPVTEEQETVRGDILAIVARNTGGVFYHNTNRLDGAITRAIEDRSVVYALDYYPHHDDWRGRFHKLEVKTSRAGVHLRYRSGYLATPPAQPSAQDQQQMLAAVAASPLDSSGIRFTVEMDAGHDVKSPRLSVHIPSQEAQWAPQGDEMTSALQVWFIQRRVSGEDLVTTTSKSDLHLTADAYKAAVQKGITLAADLKLHPATARVRVLVRDTNSGRIGTVDVPIESTPPVYRSH
jgi:hypothetical protein